MKTFFRHIGWLCSISLLILVLVGSCRARKTEPAKATPKLEASPVPLEDPGTDSLRRYLDAERENKIRKKP